MKIFKRKPKVLTPEQAEEIRVQEFFDRISPSTVKFFTDHYICGNSYKSVWAVREYPPSTEEQAILSHLADRSGVTLRIYNRLVDSSEQRQIIQHAARRNKLMTTVNDVTDSIEAENNLKDVVQLIADLRRNKEPLLHTAVFIELKASDEEKLKVLQSDILMELTRSKITVDKLVLRQKEGMLSALPFGHNAFGTLFERVLPASAVANLYPLNYSGKTDEKGFYIGRDKFGTNILVDFDKRSDDKTNANVLILGNSGQGKSYLMKLVLTNMRESGKSIICLDPEAEYEDLTNNLGGTYLDLMSGEYMINPLEPKSFGDQRDAGLISHTSQKQESRSDSCNNNDSEPEAFRKVTRLSQHISYLKDFFRTYKDFTDAEIDTIEIMLMKLYARFDIYDLTDLDKLKATDYPVMEDLYNIIEKEYMIFDHEKKHLYTEENLQNICLGLHSMCKGAESKYFNGHTNIKDSEFLCFGVKGLMDTNKKLKDTLLFNILSYMSNQLLSRGNTVAAIDELYLFLTNLTAIEYIRNAMKRVRKKESSIVIASQNIEDFLLPEIKEFTKPLFSIPTHQFYFNPGNIEVQVFIDTLQLEMSEYDLVKYPARGSCLYRCGNERYLLQVIASDHKANLFGKAGGR
ncbi:MAG: VirB4 family type IV secretion system protein [Oscillospiraceae bacterium]